MNESAEDQDMRETLERALAGDAEAYRRFLQGVAERLKADVDEEGLQDILIALHQKRDLYRAGTPVMEWVRVIARHHGVRFEMKLTSRGITRRLLSLLRR